MNERVAWALEEEAEDRAIAAEEAFEAHMDQLSDDDIDDCADGTVPATWYDEGRQADLYKFARNIWALAYEK